MFKEDRVKLSDRFRIMGINVYDIIGESSDSVFRTKVYLEFLFYHILFWHMGPFSILFFLLIPNGVNIAKNLFF